MGQLGELSLPDVCRAPGFAGAKVHCSLRVEFISRRELFIALSSRAKSRDLSTAEYVTQVGEVLRLRSG